LEQHDGEKIMTDSSFWLKYPFKPFIQSLHSSVKQQNNCSS